MEKNSPMIAYGPEWWSSGVANKVNHGPGFRQRQGMVLHPRAAPQITQNNYRYTLATFTLQSGICQNSVINTYLEHRLNQLPRALARNG